MATPIPLAYSYVRFSSKGQAGNDSERRQLELAESYAKKLGVALAPPMLDLGVSAFRGCNTSEKSALGRFLAAVTAGEIAPGSHLLIEAFDRFSRQTPLKSLKRIGELIDAGITIHVLSTKWVISQQTIDEQAHLLLVLTMYAQLANAESRQKSERISSSTADHRRRARLGEKFPGPKGPAWIDTVTLPDGKTDYVLNNSACAIQTIFELACTGMGAPNITKHLNNTNTPVVRAYASTQKNANRKLWYPAYVGRVITDRRAIGEYHPGSRR